MSRALTKEFAAAGGPLLIIPATFVALFYNGVHTDLYAVAGVLLCIAIGCGVLAPGSSPHLSFGPAGLCLLGLFFWNILSISWSSIPYVTTIYAGVIAATLIGYAVLKVTSVNAFIYRLWAGLMIALGVGFSSWMILQVLHGQSPEGPFFNVNSAGAFLNLLWPIPAAIALVLRPARPFFWAMWSAVALMVTATGLTGGRGVFIAQIAIVSALLWLACRDTRWRDSSALILVMAAAHSAAAMIGWLWTDAGSRALGQRLAALAGPADAGASRLRIWQSTLEMIRDAPWLGWGGGTFYQVYPAYRSPEDGSAGFHVHNDYLQFWVEGGLPALVFLVTLFALCAWRSLKARNDWSGTYYDRVMICIGAAVVAGACVHALFSYSFQILAYMIVLGVAIGALERGSNALPCFSLRLHSLRRKSLSVVAGLLLLAIPVIHLVAVGASAHYTNRGVGFLAAGEYELAAQELGKAARLWDAQDLARGWRAQVYQRALDTVPEKDVGRRIELKRQGLEEVALARERNPFRSMHERTRGRILNESPQPDPTAAAIAFRKALALNPRNASARIDLAHLLLDRGRFSDALELVNQGFGRHYSENNPIPLMSLGVKLREQAGDSDGAESLRQQIRGFRERAAGLQLRETDILEHAP